MPTTRTSSPSPASSPSATSASPMRRAGTRDGSSFGGMRDMWPMHGPWIGGTYWRERAMSMWDPVRTSVTTQVRFCTLTVLAIACKPSLSVASAGHVAERFSLYSQRHGSVPTLPRRLGRAAPTATCHRLGVHTSFPDSVFAYEAFLAPRSDSSRTAPSRNEKASAGTANV